MSDWPTLGEELGRKALEGLDRRIRQHAAGTISDRELWLAVDSLYDAITGLVDWDVANVLYQVREGLKLKPTSFDEEIE